MDALLEYLGEYDLSIQILGISILLLFLSTFSLLLSAIYMRSNHARLEQKIKKLEDKYYPLILDYVSGSDITKKMVEAKIRKRRLDYYVFEKVVMELIDQLQGSESDNLRELLFIDPLFNYHFKQLNSRRDSDQIKACNYYSYVRLVNYKIVKKLKVLLNHKNRMLAYSAATALMASGNPHVRYEALTEIAKRVKISEMAILDLLYHFKYLAEDQREVEAFYFQKIISNPDILEDNRAVLIEGVSEMNYAELHTFLSGALNSGDEFWSTKKILIALIKAQKALYNMDVIPRLHTLLHSEDLDIQLASVEVLAIFMDTDIYKDILSLVKGEDKESDYYILKTLMDSSGMDFIDEENLPHLTEEYRDELLNLIKPELVVIDD